MMVTFEEPIAFCGKQVVSVFHCVLVYMFHMIVNTYMLGKT